MRPNPETFLCRQGGATAERKGATPEILKGPFTGNHRHARWFAQIYWAVPGGLGCPIYNRVYKGLSLTDRIQSGGANADRNRFALSYGPFPTARKAHFDDRETDAAMFHGGPPLTFNCALIEATAFASAGPAELELLRSAL
jgi:hypothetical protein